MSDAVPQAAPLPRVDWVAPGVRKGRVPREGYMRGWGIQYKDVRDAVRADPIYRDALALANGRSVMAEDNRINLFLILRHFVSAIPFGHIVEFGSYRCGNAMFMARVLQRMGSAARVYALDTFAGMPATDASIDAHSAGDFRDVSVDEIRAAMASAGVDNVDLVQGRFEDTAAPLMQRLGQSVALAHIDSDIYSAIATAYDAVRPHMVRGGYYVFDDATVSSCLGATEAVEELVVRRDWLHAEQIFPQLVFRAGL
jgi:hypothetical protein